MELAPRGNLTAAEYANLIAEKEKELKEALHAQETIDAEEIRLAKAILELRITKKDVETAQSKARHNVRMLGLEIKQLTNLFFQAKNSGI